ncbi:hypothetical protein AWH61_06545 [Alteromonas sp. W12]|uniref:hypothetical protein n=1 Tax=Alteromonas sp. W12 TaxID=1772289 RepID=UPI00094917B9|nr:hypothetical protein [Alteromonas sp. W12]OLF79495.1 hypothetical protein AWH61_06545 [Alteromonas sp. W12]
MKYYAFFICALLSGCSVHQAWNGDKKPGLAYVSIDGQGNVVSNNKGAVLFKEILEEQGIEEFENYLSKENGRTTLFIWSAEYNGAMTNDKGKSCLQAANFARSTDITTDVYTGLISTLTKLELSGSNENDKAIALNITETLTSLSSPTKQSTYLSAGMFGLCLLQANGDLSNSELTDIAKELIKASSLVGASANQE